MSFSKKVKELREKNGLSQKELAKLIGVSQTMVAQYEMGIKIPSIVIAVNLARILGTTCEELVAE